MPFVKGQGATNDGTGTPTGRTAVRHEEEMGKGRPTPAKRQMPFARHMSIHVIMGTGPGAADDTQGAIDSLLGFFNDWKNLPTSERYRILELRFEFVTEGKLVLYIIYSE